MDVPRPVISSYLPAPWPSLAAFAFVAVGLAALGAAAPAAAQRQLTASCPKSLVLADFRTAPSSQEYIDLRNVGRAPVMLDHCVVGGFTSAAYLALVPAGPLAPGETFRFGASGVTEADASLPDGALRDAFASLVLLDAEALPIGTPIETILGAIVTSLVYLDGDAGASEVYGFYHVMPGITYEYCKLYAERLHAFGRTQCSATVTAEPRSSTPPAAPMTHEELLRLMTLPSGDGARVSQEVGSLSAYALLPNFPNPFVASTEIRFALPEPAFVRLTVFDVAGRVVLRLVEEERSAGTHAVTVTRAALPSGTYLYRLEAGPFRETRRMVVLE